MVPASCIFIKGRGFCGRDRKVVVCVEGKSRPMLTKYGRPYSTVAELLLLHDLVNVQICST